MTNSARKPSLVHAPFLVLLLIACQFAFSRAGGTPAVIWCPHNDSYSDYDSQLKTVRLNPLVKLSSEDFEESLSQLSMTDSAVIVADELCVEDLKNNKVLSLITNGSKVHYFPRVVMPDVVFEKLFSTGQIKTIEDVNDHELNMILKDTDSSRCVALTGKQCRYSERIKRDTSDTDASDDDKEKTKNEIKIQTDRVLFYSKVLMFKSEKMKKNVTLLQSNVIGNSTRTLENRTLILNIKLAGIDEIGDLVLEFFFPVKSTGYYTLEKVNSEENNAVTELLAKREIYFPYNFSYHCSLETAFKNKDAYLNITEMQVEIDYKKNAVFSDAYDCVGFTSIPIWTGIFVNVLLISILIWALVMIMDINTMDRFDDPKGKTITISTTE